MDEMEGLGQCLLKYDHCSQKSIHHGQSYCGMTFFQCAVTPILIFTDLEQWISITNSIESVATTARAMHFLHTQPKELLFFEHYHRKTEGIDSFYQVKMDWDFLNERYTNPIFKKISKNELKHLLSCYGYFRYEIPDLSFKKADVISFNPARQQIVY